MTHAAESMRWYARDGAPVYEVAGAKGQPVTPTLVHARKLGLVPSVTSVMRILAAPGLERYKINQAVLAALTLVRESDESDDSFLSRVDADSRLHAQTRADEGTQIHKAIEQHLGGHPFNPLWTAQVDAVTKLLDKLPHSFIGDFKTKESLTGKKDRELFFDDHIMQLAAYRHGLAGKVSSLEGYKFQTETTFAAPDGYGGRVDVHSLIVHPSSTLASIMISVKEPGSIVVKLWDETDAARGWELFQHALALWKLKNRYEPNAQEKQP